MTVLVDTNVILDYVLKREPFAEYTITQNTRYFKQSSVPALAPSDFLEIYADSYGS
jgi:hypothetical protein